MNVLERGGGKDDRYIEIKIAMGRWTFLNVYLLKFN
jgi:hypothetical protein